MLNNPGAARQTAGTYTGNSGNARQITTGFICRLVIVMSGSTRFWVIKTGTTYKTSFHDAAANYHDDVSSDVYLHATDGFVVGDNPATVDGANFNTHTYDYVAFEAK